MAIGWGTLFGVFMRFVKNQVFGLEPCPVRISLKVSGSVFCVSGTLIVKLCNTLTLVVLLSPLEGVL